jgi:GNAT superfamily N-acetyltransferase
MDKHAVADARIRIRQADPRDAEELIQLVHQFNQEHSQLIGGGGTHREQEAAAEVKAYLRTADTGYFVAVQAESGSIVGFRRWELHEGFYFTGPLYVVPEARGCGIARALVRYGERWVAEHGQDIACISCVPHNTAMIALARSEGYVILNTIELRKNLRDDADEPRGEAEALGLRWKVL